MKLLQVEIGNFFTPSDTMQSTVGPVFFHFCMKMESESKFEKLSVESQNGGTRRLHYDYTDLSMLSGWLVHWLPCVWPSFFVN